MATKKRRKPNRSEASKAKHRAHVASTRKHRYQTDPAYREKVREAARLRARSGDKPDRTKQDCRLNKPMLASMGDRRAVETAGGPLVMLTYSLEETALALNYSQSGLRKMIARGVIPKPVLTARVKIVGEQRERMYSMQVYTRGEVVAMMNVIGRHYVEVGRLLDEHTDVIEQIREAVAKQRGLEALEPL